MKASIENRNSGLVLGNVVNVRSKPTIKSKTVFTVKKNERIQILKKLPKIAKIGSFKDRWLKIKNILGNVGYVFGAFIFPMNILTGKWLKSNEKYEEGSEYLFIDNKLNFINITKMSSKKPKLKMYVKGNVLINGKILVLKYQEVSFLTNAREQKLYLYRYKMKNYITTENYPVGKKFKKVINPNFNKNSLCRYRTVFFKIK